MTTIVSNDNAKTWRDLTDQLTAEQIARIEDLQQRGWPPGTSQAEIALAMLVVARDMAQRNLTERRVGHVPVPAGAIAENWEGTPDDRMPYRVITSPTRAITGYAGAVSLFISAHQRADGHVDVGHGVRLKLGHVGGISRASARELAAMLLEAADELDRWADA
jgi:hypothetical protein